MGPAYDFRRRAGYDGEGDAGAGDCGGCGEEGKCGLNHANVFWGGEGGGECV